MRSLYKIIALFICMSLLCSSCSDFLEVESPSKLTEERMYATESDAYRALLGVYAVLGMNRIYGMQVSTYFGYNTDIEFGNGNAAETDDRRALWDYTATPANAELESFTYMYTAINRANECITGIENSELFVASDPDKPSMIRHLYGEAKAIRALMYMELTRNWGEVPFLEKETRADDDFYVGLTSRDTIQTHVINDLIEVEPTMYYANELNEKSERLNRGAVQGIIARLALTRGGWSLRPNLNDPVDPGYMYRPTDYLDYYRIASTYAKKLMESGRHSLKSSFRDVFYNQCQEIYPGDDDILYEVAMAVNYTSAIGHNVGVHIESNTKSLHGSNNSWYFVTLPYFYSFASGDTRREVSCSICSWYWEDVNNRLEQRLCTPVSQMRIGKWSKLFMKTPQGIGSYNNTGIDWPVIRYADVLLMYAEAENELNNGPTPEAAEALKTVRRRAFNTADHSLQVADYVDNLNDHDTFFEAIINERAWEFAGESVRKYDLIRWNLLRTKILQLKDESIQMGLECRSRTGRYGNVPSYLYYRKLDDGTIQVVNLDQNMPSNPNATLYSSFEWAQGMANAGGVINGQFDRNYRDYVIQRDPLVYIYPIHKDVIAESKGTIQNYYGKH